MTIPESFNQKHKVALQLRRAQAFTCAARKMLRCMLSRRQLQACYAAVRVKKTEAARGNKESERRDNEVGAPENRIEWLKPSLILTPRLKTSTTGTWMSRHRSPDEYNR